MNEPGVVSRASQSHGVDLCHSLEGFSVHHMRMVPMHVAAFGSFCHALVFAHVANVETPPLLFTTHVSPCSHIAHRHCVRRLLCAVRRLDLSVKRPCVWGYLLPTPDHIVRA